MGAGGSTSRLTHMMLAGGLSSLPHGSLHIDAHAMTAGFPQSIVAPRRKLQLGDTLSQEVICNHLCCTILVVQLYPGVI